MGIFERMKKVKEGISTRIEGHYDKQTLKNVEKLEKVQKINTKRAIARQIKDDLQAERKKRFTSSEFGQGVTTLATNIKKHKSKYPTSTREERMKKSVFLK